MIKSELIQNIAAANPNLYHRDVERIVNVIFEEIVNALSRGDRVELRGFGAFPSASDPRVLWVGIETSEALAKLQRQLDGALVELGFLKDERSFHAHVTVGRVKERPEGTAALPTSWSAAVEAPIASSRMTEIIVYESRSTKNGSEYVARGRAPLGKTL